MREGLRRLRRSARNLTIRLRAQARWPAALRRQLQCSGQAFARQHQLRRECLQQVAVLPFAQLLDLWRGGSVYQGGPQAVARQPIPALLHWRGARVVSDPLAVPQDTNLEPLPGRHFWCGPISDHFGHMVGEFSGRILAASLDPRDGTLLFAAREGEHRHWNNLQSWQRSLIAHLNPARKPVAFLQDPARLENLVVIPPQQRMLALPTPWQLAALEHCCRPWVGEPIEQPVVLSRARHAGCTGAHNLLGSFAGEAALDALLQRHGARVVYPEQLSLEEQLRITLNARRLVVSEGSALHGLELLGWRPHTQLVVIARRPLWPGMELPLRARFAELHWLDAVQELLWLPPANPRVKGLARLDIRQLLDRLEPCLKLRFSDDEKAAVQAAAGRQIRGLLQTLPLRRDPSPARQPREGQAGW
jgi:hypothetical protein